MREYGRWSGKQEEGGEEMAGAPVPYRAESQEMLSEYMEQK